MTLAEQWWPEMIEHEEQSRLWWSKARHRLLAAGRGSGKSENAARIVIGGDEHHRGAIAPPNVAKPLYVVAAPTRDQVKMIWWDKLKAMLPRELLAREPSETELSLLLKSGATIRLVGLDKPHRVEGIAIDGLVIDEYAEVKAEAWSSSLEPALNRRGRPGWALFIGRPKGRNHFYDRWRNARVTDGWAAYHWTSEPVLGQEALDRIRAGCDDLTFRQEYLADWINFEGLAYYQWSINDHYRKLTYDPNKPIAFCFDFNVEPGVAAIVQEQLLPGEIENRSCVIGEVHIPRNSNTPAVCRRLIADWGHHKGPIEIHGDASGGARHTSQVQGSDWDLVREVLQPKFGAQLRWRVPRSNPVVRDRINSVNSRLKSTSGVVRFAVDPSKAPNVVRDFEGVTLLKGGSGEIDKKGCEDKGLTHLSDAIGYYVHDRFPIGGKASLVGFVGP